MKSNVIKWNEKNLCLTLETYLTIKILQSLVKCSKKSKSYGACVSCNRVDKAEHRTGSWGGK